MFFILLSASPWRIIKYLLPEAAPRFFNSLTDPTASHFWHSPHRQTGKGVPQYLSRENAQFFSSFSHSPIRPSLICSGCQFIERLLAIRFFLTLFTSTHHDFLVKYIKGVLHLQQNG